MKDGVEVSVSRAPDFRADRVIGVLIMVIASLSAFAGVVAIFLGSAIAPLANDIAESDKQGVISDSLPAGNFAHFLSTVGWAAIIISVLQLLSGIGIYKSRLIGFLLGLFLAVLSLVGGPYTGAIVVGIGLYAVLRLWGNVRPSIAPSNGASEQD